MRTLRLVAALACGISMSSLALAQSENFDSYAAGSQMHGQGGWTGWDNLPAAGALVSNAQSHSAPNSVDINGGSDLVHQYSGANSGLWEYSAWQFIPTSFTGTTYFIIVNQYNHGGPYNWSIQLQFNAATGVILDDNRTENVVNFVRGQWSQIRVVADLTANTVSTFYNGSPLSTGTWTTDANSQLNIAAVDLFANNATSAFYDDISLRQVPEPASCLLLGLGAVALLRRR